MKDWVEHARQLVREALDRGDSVCSWTIRHDIFDGLRMDDRTKNALSLAIDDPITFLGIPYDLGQTRDRWGIDLHTCRPVDIDISQLMKA